jgi:hypothetical protein
MPGFGIKDIADSGSEVDEKPNSSAPKNKKTSKRCHFAVLKIAFMKYFFIVLDS